MVGLDDEVDSLLGYRSPMRGQRPQLKVAASRAAEFAGLAERIRSWLVTGIEPQAIGVAARSARLVREAREALKADGILTVPLRGRGDPQAVRVGTMHAMKGLEFQAVAVIGVEEGLVPEPGAITPEGEDAVSPCPGPAAGALRPVRGLHPGPGPPVRVRDRCAEPVPAAAGGGPGRPRPPLVAATGRCNARGPGGVFMETCRHPRRTPWRYASRRRSSLPSSGTT